MAYAYHGTPAGLSLPPLRGKDRDIGPWKPFPEGESLTLAARDHSG